MTSPLRRLGFAFAAAVLAACPDKAVEAPPPPAPAPAPVAAVVPAAPAAPVGKGTISGEVMLTGTPPPMEPLKRGADPVCKSQMNDEWALVKDGKIENVFVRVKGAPATPPPATPVEVFQKDCMYRPRVQGAVAGQQVSVRNEDGTLHNVHSYSGASTLFNRAQPPRSPAIEEKIPLGTTAMKLRCDVHPWMLGYVLFNNNASFAVTGGDGRFEIKDVPAGSYTIEAWQERFGTKTLTVTVVPDQTAKVTFTYSADDRG